MAAKSLLFGTGQVLEEPPDCARVCRKEVTARFKYKGNLYTLVMRDKVIIEDPYMVLVKAGAYATRTGGPYQGRIVPRSVRDFLIKSTVEGA